MRVKANSGGGGEVNWFPAKSYPTNSMTFEWNYPADAVVIAFTFYNSYKDMVYIDLTATPYTIGRGTFGNVGKANGTSLSSLGLTLTLDADSKGLTLTHSGQGFLDGYILPLSTGSTKLPT